VGETIIWLARHGEVHNPKQVLYGRLPRWGLSVEGQRQARAVADFLGARPLTAIYSSPMLRARKTAAEIARQHPDLRVRIERRIIEIGSGWDGSPYSELEKIHWDYYSNPHSPTDETLEQIRDRMMGWVNTVLNRHEGQEVAGVSHGDPLLVITAHLRGDPMQVASIRTDPYIPTACVFRLRFEDGVYKDARMFVPHAD
jgi:probable phosphoglycerate mutase